jgi:oligopeptide transport system substrate-binding protein
MQDRFLHAYADEYITTPSLAVVYVAFNTSRPPFDDVRVRRAFAHSIDRETLATVALQGIFTPATGGMVPPGMPGHVPDTAPLFDPQLSRRLLSEAGYPDPSHFPEIECLVPDYPVIALPRQFVASQWQHNLGLTLGWRTLEWSSFLKRLGQDLPELSLFGWVADYPDPDSFLRLAVQEFHAGQIWKHDEYLELVERARRTLDHATRMQLYDRAQKLLAEEVPLIPLLYVRGHYLLKPWIAEYPLSPLRWDYFKDVVIEPHD